MNSNEMPLLGRCKNCDYAIFATSEDVKEGESLNDVKGGAGVFRVNNGFVARCTNNHRVFPVRRIKGKYSKDHKCDARCLNARGNDCTCSCGGANHGRGHVAAMIVASEAREPGHIGEVGKRIRGTAKLIDKRELGEKRLFKFATAKGDRIVWFVPAEHAPDFEVNQEVTFRAKVTKHEDHERFGKSTVVNYLEEV